MAQPVAVASEQRAKSPSTPQLPSVRIIGWGFLPALSLVSAFGLVLTALADNGGRSSAAWATPLFWLSLLVLFMPIAWRLLSLDATRKERIGLVVVLGVTLYLVKVLRDPLAFTYLDELEHWPTANSILQTHHLFHYNTLLRISPLFPGLENVVSALATIGGLSIFDAAIIVVGVARLVLVLALYFLYEMASRSQRVAGLAVLLYMANPNFLFFDAQFAYESLSLALAALTLFLVARRQSAPAGARLGSSLAAMIGISAVVVTHHLTSYALAILLIIWTVVALYTNPRAKEWAVLGSLAIFAVVASGVWIMFVASPVLAYVGGPFHSAADQFLHLVTGQRTARKLFSNPAARTPLWDIVTGYASVALILLGLPFGLWRLWQRHRTIALAVVLALGALAYPVSLGLRLTPGGTETSNRSSEFLFVGIAFVLAIAVAELETPHRVQWMRWGAFLLWASIIFIGGITIGTAPYARLPGPYLVGADQRSVDARKLTTAEWARMYLGPGNRMLTDRMGRELMGSYGEQDPQQGFSDGMRVALVFFSRQFDAADKKILHGDGIRYIVVDQRLSTALPLQGEYYDANEPNGKHHTTPVSHAALVKFDNVEGVSRVFDNGSIKVYDVGVYGGCSRTVDHRSLCVNGNIVGTASVTPSASPTSHMPSRHSQQPQGSAKSIPQSNLLLNTAVISFGVQRIHSPSAIRTIYVVNLQQTPLTIAHVTITGRDKDDFHEVDTCTGVTINAYNRCSIDVGFIPAASGTRKAAIVIDDNTGDHRYVPLSGQGQSRSALVKRGHAQ